MCKGRYKNLPKDKSSGKVYTPKELSTFVAEQMLLADTTKHVSTVSVLDPSVGEGSLLEAFCREFIKTRNANLHLYGFDIDNDAVTNSKIYLNQQFCDQQITIQNKNFLDISNYYLNNHTLLENTTEKYDYIITNPPYVRTQVIGSKESQRMSKLLGLSGRVDLYQIFILLSLSALKDNGVAGLIVSNRFMTTKSGFAIRNFLQNNFEIIKIVDFGDTKLFSAAVLPAVLILKKKRTNNTNTAFISIYESKLDSNDKIESIFDVLNSPGIYQTQGKKKFEIKHGHLDYSDSSAIWRIKTEESDAFMKSVNNNTWNTFSHIGKIRVGVKTTADKIFIRTDWGKSFDEVEPELLKPLITHRVARKFKMKEDPTRILYPHTMHAGKRVAVNIPDYPKAYSYLLQHKELLANREYLIKSGRKWYEIWVPQSPALWKEPKLVFRDISEKATFWLDNSGAIVNGDCYWIVPDCKEKSELLWLALAVSNSSFIEEFYDHKFCNKLYAGRRRFISQYVEKFPLPDPDLKISKELIAIAKTIHANLEGKSIQDDYAKLENLVWNAFGLVPKSIG